MSVAIALSDEQSELEADPIDLPGRSGAPAARQQAHDAAIPNDATVPIARAGAV